MQIIVKHKTFLLLLIIIAVALFSRLYQLEKVPVGFHYDEAQVGYNAYSLLKTGHDKNNVLLPLSIDQFGDFRPAGYHYVTAPFIALLGLNEFATRLPGALFGAFSVIPIFFLSKKLFKNEMLGLISAALLALVPWHIVTSRATSESVVAMFFVLSGAVLFLYFIENKKNKFLITSYFLFSISFFFYHSARFFVPIFLFSQSVLFFLAKDLKFKSAKKLIVGNIALITVLALLIFFSKGAARPTSISIFSTPETSLVLNEQIREDGGQNPLLTRFFHNKPVNYLLTFSNNYVDHFSGKYLFLQGGFPPRYTVIENGVLYPVLSIFLIIGMSYLVVEFFQKRSLRSIFILSWLILGPVPAALSFEDLPNIIRSIMTLPPLLIIVVFGTDILWKQIRPDRIRLVFGVAVGILFLYNVAFFVHGYFHHSFTHRPWYRSVGEKELVKKVEEISGKKRQTILTRGNENDIIFFLFYRKVDPNYYFSLGSPRGSTSFENLKFVDLECPLSGKLKQVKDKEALYVNRGNCNTPTYAREVATIKSTDNTNAFIMLEVDPEIKEDIRK